MFLLLVIILLVLFAGGSHYGYRQGYYGNTGRGAVWIILVVILIFILLRGGFGHGPYLRY